MGLSVSAASAILFISFILIFTTMTSVLVGVQDGLIDAYDDQSDRQSESRASSMDITGVDEGNDTITVVNTGDVAMDPSELSLMVDGVLYESAMSGYRVEGIASTHVWGPEETLVIDVDLDLDGSRVKLVSDSGAEAYSG